MAVIAGYFRGEDPVVPIAVAPRGQPAASQPFTAVVDTRYRGFLQMPLEAGEALGLQRFGTPDQERPDEGIRPVPLALGCVVLGGASQEAVIHLQGADVRVGLEFFRAFAKIIYVSRHEGRVVLADSVEELTAPA